MNRVDLDAVAVGKSQMMNSGFCLEYGRIVVALLLLVMISVPGLSWAEFSCPDETRPTCLVNDEKICAVSTKCVDQAATCFDDFPCDPDEGIVCAAEYDAALDAHRFTTVRYDQLAAENVDLRQRRLERKNCVLNATSLVDAQTCVR